MLVTVLQITFAVRDPESTALFPVALPFVLSAPCLENRTVIVG